MRVRVWGEVVEVNDCVYVRMWDEMGEVNNGVCACV